jgi:exodeoxyribonuclease-3
VFSGQKTYNGVAILSRQTANDVQFGIPNFADEQKRVIAATIAGIRVVCIYVPNGQSVGSDKYNYKLAWLAALHDWLKGELVRYPELVLLGDYNIAPEDRDVYDPVAWQGNVLVSEAERQQFQSLLQLGLRDSFRLFEQADKSYSWWDYRMMAFRRNLGLRIDHILVSEPLVATCKSCVIDRAPRKLERPSDHAPVVVELYDFTLLSVL